MRYKEQLHTPGEHKPGPAEIVRNDPAVLADWNAIHTRRQELEQKLAEVNGELTDILADLGELVAGGANYQDDCKRLGELRLDAEVLAAGVEHLENQAAVMRRLNNWLA